MPEASMPEALPVGYYLDNFHFLLDHVERQYGDILSAEEGAYAAGFRALSGDAQRLYVRLASRKGPLFRSDKLNYPEIEDMQAAWCELVAAGYADHGEEAEFDDVIGLLTRPELFQLEAGIRLERASRRESLVERLHDVIDVPDIVAQCDFTILQPLALDLLAIYKLLFFGNMHQDFTEFVLNDLGITPFEAYPIHRDVRFFEDRCVIDQTLMLYELRDVAEELVESGDADCMVEFVSTMPGKASLVSERLHRRRDRIVNHVARQLEREQALEAALEAYGTCTAAPSRERRARILDRLGHEEQAIDICRQIIDAPEDEAEYEFAVRFSARLCKKAGLAPVPELPDLGRDDFPWREISVPADPNEHVEMLARQWFEAEGFDAWYVENGLLPGLFGLCFWDIIFHPVRGAFHHPFQRGPADLFTPEFKQTRKELIEKRLDELETPSCLRRYVERRYREKQPLANHFVDWRLLDETLLDRALAAIPHEHLLSIFRRLLRDLKSNRSGFPDLIVFSPAGGYLLAEVKGPGDTLQNNQKRWLRHFRETGMPAEVVRVSWQ